MIRFALCLVLAVFATQAWADDAAATSGVDPLVSRCYAKLQQRVPKRTHYTSIAATDAQLQAAKVESWDKAFSDRINKKVATKVTFDGEVAGKKGATQAQVFHCGYSDDKIVTWEVRTPRS